LSRPSSGMASRLIPVMSVAGATKPARGERLVRWNSVISENPAPISGSARLHNFRPHRSRGRRAWSCTRRSIWGSPFSTRRIPMAIPRSSEKCLGQIPRRIAQGQIVPGQPSSQAPDGCRRRSWRVAALHHGRVECEPQTPSGDRLGSNLYQQHQPAPGRGRSTITLRALDDLVRHVRSATNNSLLRPPAWQVVERNGR